MLKRSEVREFQKRARALINKSGLRITEEELEKIDVSDFGLSNQSVEGAQILTFIATHRIAVKLIILLPYQSLPEHWHPPVGDDPGK
jgi:D-lyxose ketol-isomerase